MAQPEERGMKAVLDAWPELAPDPAAMDRVTALMMAGMAVARPAAVAAAAPGEAQFRLLTYIWGAVALGTYLAWDLLSSWFQAHPTGLALLIGVAVLSLLAPLLLLLVPMLRGIEAPADHQGGTIVC